MKFNKKIRKELLNKLGFAPGSFPTPQIDVEKLLQTPLDAEPEVESEDSVAAPTNLAVQSIDPAMVDEMIRDALTAAVDAYLTDIENKIDPEFAKEK